MLDLHKRIPPNYGEPYTVRGEGDGWIAWTDALASHIAILADDGETAKSIAIRDSSVISDMLASAAWVSGLSERERERALLAVEALEGAHG